MLGRQRWSGPKDGVVTSTKRKEFATSTYFTLFSRRPRGPGFHDRPLEGMIPMHAFAERRRATTQVVFVTLLFSEIQSPLYGITSRYPTQQRFYDMTRSGRQAGEQAEQGVAMTCRGDGPLAAWKKRCCEVGRCTITMYDVYQHVIACRNDMKRTKGKGVMTWKIHVNM